MLTTPRFSIPPVKWFSKEMKEHKEAPVLQPESRRSNLHTSNFDPLHGRIEWEMKGKYLMALNIYTSINIPGQERR